MHSRSTAIGGATIPVVRSAVLLLLAAMILPACSDAGSDSAPAVVPPHDAATYEYVVPVGTGERLDAGDEVELMPAQLKATVGESIFILNQDTRDHDVGPFFVAAGQSLAMEFTRATILSGMCQLNPAGVFEIIITE